MEACLGCLHINISSGLCSKSKFLRVYFHPEIPPFFLLSRPGGVRSTAEVQHGAGRAAQVPAGPLLHPPGQVQVRGLPDPQAAGGPGLGAAWRDAAPHAALRREVIMFGKGTGTVLHRVSNTRSGLLPGITNPLSTICLRIHPGQSL